jgi:hypothetical protein
MVNEMRQLNDTARAHMNRDTESSGKWMCTCEACRNVRSLVGMEKVLDIWPIVNELRRAEERLSQLPEGPEKQHLAERWSGLQDQLAMQVAK